jgi:hypothetical protein
MTTFKYKGLLVEDFQELVDQPFDLKSPYRSTVPLLAFWRQPDRQLENLANALKFQIPQSAVLTFEFMVAPGAGSGKASHTDLMLEGSDFAIGIEAKYTEPDYKLVSKWLGKTPTENRKSVLEGWLEMINEATGSRLTVGDVTGIAYQLIHRTASVCNIAARERVIAYHCFDPSDERQYQNHMRQLATLVGSPDHLKFFLLSSTINKSAAYSALQAAWERKESRDLSAEIRSLLIADDLGTFGGLSALAIN